MVTKEEGEKIAREIIKYSKINENGNIILDSGIQSQIIGKIKNKDLNEKKEITKEELDELKIIIGQIYENILKELYEYCDLREEYYHLVATWIIGTYLHKSFNTYPYLFLNAMRGSGKTRLLKLISSMALNGNMIGSPTEAVLFRIPNDTTLCIDEFEGVTRKGNEGARQRDQEA